MPRLTFERSGPIPSIDVRIGRAQLGNYTFALWDANGRNPRVPGSGVNNDDIEDVFSLTRTRAEFEALHGHILDGIVWVKALKRGRKRYAIRVEISQGGSPVAVWEDNGDMTSSMKNLEKSWTVELI